MHTLVFILIVVAAALAAIAAAIAFGGPSRLPPMQSVSDPFKSVDFSDLPPIDRCTARDGTQLAHRRYGPSDGGGKGSVVYVLDVRGHGESGEKGQIAYVGQLEDDIEDFVHASMPPGRRILVGFSAGGGFVLRFAADARRQMFDAYLLLSPFLGQRASTYRPASGGWVSVGLLRMLGLLMLNRLREHAHGGARRRER